MKKMDAGLSAVRRAEKLEAKVESLTKAVRAILKDPYGCVFCDSGKLRNPSKSHTAECGFALAADALTAGEGGDK